MGWKVKLLLVIGTLTVILVPVVQRLGFYFRTGTFFPHEIIESLANPIVVNGWNEEGLILADGKVIPLPEIDQLPRTSIALKSATENGIEIAEDGRVYGLIKILHWCGNDPVENHLARVDLSYLLVFVGDVDSEFETLNISNRRHKNGGSITEFGWDITEYYSFKGWLNNQQQD